MFGTKKIPQIKSWTKIINNFNQNKKKRMYDLDILNKIVKQINNNDILVHTTCKKFPGEITKDYPMPYDSYCNFIGQYVDSDESTKIEHNIMLRNN